MSAAPRRAARPTDDPAIALRQAFLDAMAAAAHSVYVVATDGPAGRAGATVSAMTSVSVDGPQPVLLLCLQAASRAAGALLENHVFSVNLLAEGDSEIADVFAGRRNGVDKFAHGAWGTGRTGAPVLGEARAGFECRLVSAERVGAHFVIFGAVERAAAGDGAARAPLLYSDRRYRRLAPADPDT